MKKLLVFLLGIFCLAACNSGNTPSVQDEGDMQLATNVSIFSSKENQKEWVLHADSVNFENMQSAALKNPQLFLKQDGEDSARVSGEMGTFDYAKQLVTIEGNAVLESLTEKARITAPRFFYDITQDKIWSDARTVITRGTARSVAINGVETNSKLTKIVIKKHATQLPKNRKELQKNAL
ncbi:MAG: LPS export ABC transporter periplasmic protein LptC [Elusimicrobiaceae bacterium]|nr:LPS export ABC transporter periplasmic protein LptC [Elusimicrobiaceae bacterium]